MIIIIQMIKLKKNLKKVINEKTTELLNHIEKERFIENILSIKISKRKEVDYSVTS